MNTQHQFPLFDIPDNALIQIFSYLNDEEYNTMLSLYERNIPETISKMRLKESFGEDLVIDEKIANRGWHYITKNLLQYTKNQAILPNTSDNRYFVMENNHYTPLTTNEMSLVTHIAQHSFGRHKKLSLVKNYEEKRIVVQSPINYFEVTFEEAEGDMTYVFGIGMCSSNYDKSKMVGWERHSIGYHSDDGKMFYESGRGKSYAETYGKGDTIGCGFDSLKNIVFFTKNGTRLQDVRVEDKTWYPAISMKKYKPFRINFGEEPFMYDVYQFKPRDEDMEKIEELEREVQKETREVSALLDLLNGLMRDLGGSDDSDDDDSDSDSSESEGTSSISLDSDDLIEF